MRASSRYHISPRECGADTEGVGGNHNAQEWQKDVRRGEPSWDAVDHLRCGQMVHSKVSGNRHARCTIEVWHMPGRNATGGVQVMLDGGQAVDPRGVGLECEWLRVTPGDRVSCEPMMRS